MKIYHLSHNDLDGYGCQFITSKIFKNIRYFNSNYGDEVLTRFNSILEDIKESEKEEIQILITDVNLTLKEADFVDKEVKKLIEEGFVVNLQLLDHHITGIDCRDKFSWYHLDDTKSASMLTFDFFKEKHNIESFAEIIKVINAIDIWLEDDKYFEFGKVLQRAVNHDSKEISTFLFPDEARAYKFHIIDKSIEFLDRDSSNIDLDENIYFIKKEFLRAELPNNTLDNISAQNIVKLLKDNKDEMSIFYKGQKGLLTYMIGPVSIVANEFLKQNSEFDFFMDFNYKGTVSFRANNKIDVSQMAKHLADGGGHKNASGGKIKGFKEAYNYKSIKNFITKHIEKKEETV